MTRKRPLSKPRPVEIFRKPDRTGFRVAPSLRVYKKVGEGPDFQLVNRTHHTARVDFAHDKLVFDVLGGRWLSEAFDLPAGATSGPLRVNDRLPARRYKYTVLLVEPGLEAEGGSRPDIEIRK